MLPFFRGDDRGPRQEGIGGRRGALGKVDPSVGWGPPQAMTPHGMTQGMAVFQNTWLDQAGKLPTAQHRAGAQQIFAKGTKISSSLLSGVASSCLRCRRPGLCGEWLIVILGFGLARGRGSSGLASSVKFNPSSENPGRHGSTSFLPPLGCAPLNLSRPLRTFPGRKCPGSAWAPCWG